METARQVPEEMRSRVLKHGERVLPPRNAKEAEMLAAAGDAILPHLEYSKWKSRGAKTIAACARAVALVGTNRAVNMLADPAGYGNDQREVVVSEICRCPAIDALSR